MSNESQLTIIILSYNSHFWLKKTLQSLKEFYLDVSKTKVRTVVVDNNSTDPSVAMVKEEFPEVELMELPENEGFAAGNNHALRTVTTPYVMLLNSDVELTAQTRLDELLSYLDTHPQVGIVTPRVELAEGKLDMASHRGEPTVWASLTYFLGLEKLFPKVPFLSRYHLLSKDFTQVHEIEACSAAAMMIRSHAMDKVGLLDDQFFMYAEDLDWCKRFREEGFSIVYYPQVTITHHKYKSGLLSSSKPIKAKTREYFYDTMLQYYDKHYQTKYPRWVRSIIKYVVDFKKGAV